jgi:SagB-type dehydrogenase family enzyme
MSSTESAAAEPIAKAADDIRAAMNGARVKTEALFAGDDTAAVDAFHARTTWGPALEGEQLRRIRAFLHAPVLREIAVHSRNEPSAIASVALPDADLGALTLQEAIARRRSLVSDAAPHGAPIALEDLAAILKHSYGVTREQRDDAGLVHRLRACPSAGALYPLEVYPVVMDVAGLDAGIYHYDVFAHSLSLLRRDDTREAMPGFDWQPGFRSQASVVFVVTAVLLRSMAKYLDRGYRFALNEAGALCQNLHLTAVARGLAGCTWGGFCDDAVAKYVGADGTREIAVLGFVLGRREAMPIATK